MNMNSLLWRRGFGMLAALWLVLGGIGLSGREASLQAQIPERPEPPRLVNDLAVVFSSSERKTLEWELVAFDDSTSNQIAVVTLPTFGDYAAADLAYEIGRRWGVGQADFNNGLVVLIKPKSRSERGEVFIATGYGLEGAIPDAVCKRIIEDVMIPRFRENDYYGGTQAALQILKALAVGEIKAADDDLNMGAVVALCAIIIGGIVLFAVALAKASKGDDRGLAALLLGLHLLSSGSNRSHGGSWGGFTGGTGGFGGFGGGGFGGGGAGGSW